MLNLVASKRKQTQEFAMIQDTLRPVCSKINKRGKSKNNRRLVKSDILKFTIWEQNAKLGNSP